MSSQTVLKMWGYQQGGILYIVLWTDDKWMRNLIVKWSLKVSEETLLPFRGVTVVSVVPTMVTSSYCIFFHC